MVEEKTFELGHSDFVMDMCLDHYGRRLATCSQDGIIKIFRRTNSVQGWEEVYKTPAASSGINKLSWSHPEFSMLLACCTDRSIIVWEEEEENEWKQLFYNAEFSDPICGLEFGPKHLGLRLAVSTGDGKVRIYSPTDALRKEWMVRHTFNVSSGDTSESSVTGGGGGAGGMDVADYSTLTSCLSWNTFSFDAPSMVVGSGKTAFFWKMDREKKRWRQIGQLPPQSHNAVVNHVAWAPNMGRSFHMIATASSDGTAKIWKLETTKPTSSNDKSSSLPNESDSLLGDGNVEVSLMHVLDHPNACEVFRVEWNLTATMLSTSCDDGIVRLWSPNLRGEWTTQLNLDDRAD